MKAMNTGQRSDRASGKRFACNRRIGRQSGVLKAKITQVLAFSLFLGLTGAPLVAQNFSHSSEIVSDPVTGAALMGFDPVAYFIENRALPGDPALQISFSGKAWYFMSAANRLAFRENRRPSCRPSAGTTPPRWPQAFCDRVIPKLFCASRTSSFSSATAKRASASRQSRA
jgi:hypothetical protein